MRLSDSRSPAHMLANDLTLGLQAPHFSLCLWFDPLKWGLSLWLHQHQQTPTSTVTGPVSADPGDTPGFLRPGQNRCCGLGLTAIAHRPGWLLWPGLGGESCPGAVPSPGEPGTLSPVDSVLNQGTSGSFL